MNATQTRGEEISQYLDRVREALADLPAEVRDELLEDLPAHLAEVASEDSGALATRLGPPERYAAELRAAAGVSPGTADGGGSGAASVIAGLATRARSVDTRLGPLLGYSRFSDFVRLLRPAWWLVRGGAIYYLLVVFVFRVAHGILPRYRDELLIAVPLGLVCLVASIWYGRRSAGYRMWPRRLTILANALLAFVALTALFQIDGRARSGGSVVYESPYSSITDIYPRGSDGQPLNGVTLYDQNGQQIQLGDPWHCPYQGQGAMPSFAYPLCPQGQAFGSPAPATSGVSPAPNAPSGGASSTSGPVTSSPRAGLPSSSPTP